MPLFSGVKSFWVIQNNEPVIRSVKKLNARGSARSISTFDFSTLYTKIPHNKLIFVLNNLIDFCFKGGTNKYVALSSSGAHWRNEPSDDYICYNKEKVKSAVKYLIDNCYFTLGGKLYRQSIGIPMGSDPAPFMANLFLYYYENQWIRNLKKTDLKRARLFCNTFRFIDDLIAINDQDEFERNFLDIYPPELQLKKESTDHQHASFLDLDISIDQTQFKLQLFDKRDSFPFSIVRMPYCCSNMPSSIFYSSVGAEILRIGRSTTTLNNFKNTASKLLLRMSKQGTQKHKLERLLIKTYNRHTSHFLSFANNSSSFVHLLLD